MAWEVVHRVRHYPRRKWVASLLVLLGAASMGVSANDARSETTDVPQNLILISIDTLRADRLGAYGYPRDTSPTLDALAARGARVETVISESSWTLPSHASLLSGYPPAIHGARLPDSRLPDEVPLLAEMLRSRGFRTFAWTGGVFVGERHGLHRGFERWNDQGLGFASALAETLQQISRVDPKRRFFAFVHTYDVHCPYDPPAVYAARFQRRPESDFIETAGRCGNPHYNAMSVSPGQAAFLSDRYDGGIRYADDMLRQFFDRLKAMGVLEKTLVVVVSDHGDEFLEHGRIGHRGSLYIQSLRVPCIMAGPGVAPQVVGEPAGLVDVVPTLLDLLALPAVRTWGRSLVPVMRGRRAVERERMLFSETEWGDPLYSAIVGDRHTIVDAASGAESFFDWRADPAEGVDRADTPDTLQSELRRLTRAHRRKLQEDPGRMVAVPIPTISASDRAKLEALGYVAP